MSRTPLRTPLQRINPVMSRRSVVGLLAASILVGCLAVMSARAGSSGPELFIEELGNEVVALLQRQHETSFSEREAAFRDLLVKGFDMRTISRAVLGAQWRELSPEELSDYQDVFTNFVVRIYAVRFQGYTGQQFKVLSVHDAVDGDLIVRTQIEFADSTPPITLDFLVRQNSDDYGIIDVSVEGISMLITQRAEFAAVIDRHGLTGLIDQLRDRVETPAETSEN